MIEKFSLAWIPMPSDARNGLRTKKMTLPGIIPPNYNAWRYDQKTWFWHLFWALVTAGGYLAVGPDLWRVVGSRTEDKWDARSRAVLSAFETLRDESDGTRYLCYAPLLKIMREQAKKIPKISEVSTEIHREGEGSSTSSSQSGFDFDSAQIQKKGNARERRKAGTCPIHGDAGRTPEGRCGACYGEKYADAGGCEPA